jgi:REP element-mobilizing transposase RayT
MNKQSEFMSYELVLQVSHCLDNQMSWEGAVRQNQRSSRGAFRELAHRRKCLAIEGRFCPLHVHMYLTIPPKYAVSQVAG